MRLLIGTKSQNLWNSRGVYIYLNLYHTQLFHVVCCFFRYDLFGESRGKQVVFGLTSSNSGRPDLGLTMQADYYGNQAIVKGFSLVDGRVRLTAAGF